MRSAAAGAGHAVRSVERPWHPPRSRSDLRFERAGTHAYSILDARELGALPGIQLSGLLGKTKLIHVRNPWGRFEWRGAWSDHSAELRDATVREELAAEMEEAFAEIREEVREEEERKFEERLRAVRAAQHEQAAADQADHAANPLQRDARSNLPLHLCCAIDDRAVAGLLAAQPEMGAHSFEGYGTQNRRHVTPLALCDASGVVAALVAKLR